MKSEKKGKRLRLFDLQREGKGISKKQAELDVAKWIKSEEAGYHLPYKPHTST